MAGSPTPLTRAALRARVTAHAVRHLGAHTVGLILANSARRQVHTARHQRARKRPAVAVTPGRLVRSEVWNPGPGTARFHFERGLLEVAFLASDVVRVSWGPGPEPVPYALAGPTTWGVPDVSAHPLDVLRADGPWVLRSETLEVTVSPDGSMRTATPGGATLRQESAPERRGAAWQQSFTLRPGERLSGLGEQSAGVDLRGTTRRLWNSDPGGSWGPGASPLYLGVPTLVGSHPDGDVLTFWENSSDATMGLGTDDDADAVIGFGGGVLRRYLATGSLPHVLDRYSELTGRPALPPRWALGYHQSRWGYRSDADVRAVTDGFGDLGLPLSAVHLDIDYMRGYRVFTVDTERFPDLAGLAEAVGGRGVRLVTIVDPGVKVDPDDDVYSQGRAEHRFCTDERGHVVEGVVWPGRAVFPDFTDPATRRWWAGLYRRLTDAGVAGVWHDMNEPTSISLLGDPTLPLSTRHHLDGRGADHGEAHNLYGLLMDRAGHEGLRAARPERRPFVLSRSGWAGMQRYAWAWTGDTASTWAAMRQQVATVVGLGLSGVPYSGSDTGGFSGAPDAELYLRWLQVSVFMPLCRTHSVRGVPAREPWCWGEPAGELVGAWIRFRYRLLPYLYTLAHEASASGAPLVRPLWWPGTDASPDDARPHDDADEAVCDAPRFPDADDAFLLGDALLVAVVTAAGVRQRTLTPPPGAWSSLWGDDVVVDPAGVGGPGPASPLLCGAPLARPPVLVRAGVVVPLDDGWARPGDPCALADDPPGGAAASAALPADHAPLRLAFHCWPDARGDAEGRCVDDAGDGDGPTRHDVVRVTGAVPGGTAHVVWERTGDFPPPAAVRVVLHGLVAAGAVADGAPVAVSGPVATCPCFSELTLHGLTPAPGRGR